MYREKYSGYKEYIQKCEYDQGYLFPHEPLWYVQKAFDILPCHSQEHGGISSICNIVWFWWDTAILDRVIWC